MIEDHVKGIPLENLERTDRFILLLCSKLMEKNLLTEADFHDIMDKAESYD
jgi:hypothetical protein